MIDIFRNNKFLSILGVLVGLFAPLSWFKFLYENNIILLLTVFLSPIFLVIPIMLLYINSIPLKESSSADIDIRYKQSIAIIDDIKRIYFAIIAGDIIFIFAMLTYDIMSIDYGVIMFLLCKFSICLTTSLFFSLIYIVTSTFPSKVRCLVIEDYKRKEESLRSFFARVHSRDGKTQ